MGSLGGRRIGWGVLGTGRIAREFAAGLRRLPEAELVAVGSREEARARRFAADTGASRGWGSYGELVADPGVDVVYVATPNSEHHDHCVLALSADKAVLCEKPFATSAREARAVVAVARERKLFCMEAMWTRFIPLMARAEGLVREGAIGEPLAFRADFGITVPSRENRVFRPELGGGALLDLGVYLLAASRSFLGPPLEAFGHARVGPTGVDEQDSILLRHAGERHSLLFASILGDTRAEAVVMGSHGQLRIHPPFYRPHRISIERFGASLPGVESAALPMASGLKERLRDVYRRFEDVLGPIARRPASSLFEPPEGNGYHYQAAEVERCLRAGLTESPRMPLDETIETLVVMDRLRAAWGVRLPGDQW